METITIDWRALTAEEVLHAVHDRAINSMNHEAEREIRAYGRTTPETNKVVAAVDARRRTNITRALEGAGVSPSDADALGRIGIALLIAEQQNVPVDREAMRVMYDEYLEWALAKLHRATDGGVPVLAQGGAGGAAAEAEWASLGRVISRGSGGGLRFFGQYSTVWYVSSKEALSPLSTERRCCCSRPSGSQPARSPRTVRTE